mmetsp:Transcript_9734/g.21790  ORF Transcript_9734/g.21790 Transcript_9734/m.21790 type:complete len:404 (+) Transcript_9734:27-1238(+)
MAGHAMDLAPGLTDVQRRAASRPHFPVPACCVVTGGSGFVGQRLVEMLVERGAKRVVSFDIRPPPPGSWEDGRIEYVIGDLRKPSDLSTAVRGADCVWHLGAAVGPFHPTELYEEVNYHGTRHLLEACRSAGVPKLVFSSSPSTRMTGCAVDGLSELEMPRLPLKRYLQDYARTKAMGEMLVAEACCDELLTVAVAPHTVYGPRDTLFLPNILESAGVGKLRVFGNGQNRVCFSHVDNYCHGLILAERALQKGAEILGQFYICSDAATHPHPEGYCIFWDELEKAIVGLGFPSIQAKLHLPVGLMMFLGYVCSFFGFLLGRKFKLSPFTVKMLTIHRWFKFDRPEQDLGYKPIIPFEEGWPDTIEWFRTVWLPNIYNPSAASGYGQLHSASQQKIEQQSKKAS